MTLTARTKQYFLIAALASATALVAAAYLTVQIRGQGARLEANSIAINESAARVEASLRAKNLIAETEDDRLRLKKAFFHESSDSLDFLTLMETLAPQFGVELGKITLEEVKNPTEPKKTEMKFLFGYTGTKEAVLDFTRLLENLPHHSRLETFTLRSSDGVWEGSVEVRITVRPL